MAADNLAIVFRGKLVEGAALAQVKANFARLFNADAARVEQMFAGQAVMIKKGLDAAGAEKYRQALEKAGALVEILDLTASAQPVARPAAPASSPAPAATPAAAPAASASPPPTASANRANDPALARAAPPAALRGTPQALESSLAEPGVVLVEAQHVAAPDIATDHLSVAAVGERLVDYTPPPPLAYDLSGLSLDAPGVTLSDARPAPPPEFDLSGLSLDDTPR
ncbi:MAG: hypothetical protein K2Y51_03845 [Gammaproteobacteria bacterium]|nr:hypothetical protein [Gammaproteobacteria bacterium]